MTHERFDLAVVGAGIVGLAHALAAARRGMRVVVIDRETEAVGASIRNFGFITVTGQSEGAVWRRAMRTRDVWDEIALQAGIPIVHRNECVIAHSTEAMAVLEQFQATEMGDACEVLSAHEVAERAPVARMTGVAGGLWSPHELRVEPRTAIPALAAHLEAEYAVVFRRGVHVRAVSTPEVETSAGTLYAQRVVVAPGPDLRTLFPQTHARFGVRQCKLQMLRLEPQPGGWRLPASIMSDFGLVRYLGFAAQPAARELRAKLVREHPRLFDFGIHLIVVQSADGSLVIGDSHAYAATHDPFYSGDVEAAILDLAGSVLDIPNRAVIERWVGIYPQSEGQEWFVDAPDAHTRLVQVTAGNGMSSAFGLAEEVLAAW